MASPSPGGMKYVRDAYRVPAKRGALVRFLGVDAVIASASNGRLNIRAVETGELLHVHPTWEMEYDVERTPEG